ncbi:ABC transporter substrate-binding protein [Enterocloster asparagiformis]|nr:ABC transporter substrate-binding protein [Enterocloster asparagiformis]
MKRRVNRLLAGATAIVMMALTACSGGGQTPASQAAAGSTQAAAADSQAEAPADQKEEPAAGEPKYGGQLRVTLNNDPASMDPLLEDSEPGQIPAAHIFETALCNNIAGEICPQVCTFEEKDNQVILKVREGVTFHDGSPCEIADVEASANRWLNNVKMARTYVGDLMESMKVEGDSLVFTFKDPAPLATTMMSGWDRGLYVMPKELCEKYPDSKIADADLIGTGPYKFVEHLADRYIKMEKYQDYKPLESDETGMAETRHGYVDTLYFYSAPDINARISGVQTDEYDIAFGVPDNMRATLEADPNLDIEIKDLSIYCGLVFNYEKGQCADVNLRNAILACLDMDSLMLAAQGSADLYYLNPTVVSTKSKWFCEESLGKYNAPDIEKAKDYLSKSSYDGSPLVFITTKDNAYMYKTALALADMVKPAGITIDIQVYDNATLKDYRMDPDKFDMFSSGLSEKVDPTQIAFFEDGWAGFYKSEKKDELMAKMNAESDFNKRYEYWEEMCKVLYEDLPIITFGERRVVEVKRKTVHNTFDTVQKFYWNIWVD